MTPFTPSIYERPKVRWDVTVDCDQEKWALFCLQFMCEEMVLFWRGNTLVCRMSIDPYKPIDSTGSMPSFVAQASIWFKKIVVVS